MTVARDAVLEFATFTTTSPATLSFTPTGTPRGVVVHIVINGATTDTVTAVTYGGVAMQRVVTMFEPTAPGSRVWTYFLGSGIPTGAQTVSITHGGTAQTKWAIVQTFTAAGDTEPGTDGLIRNGSAANPSILLDSGAISAIRTGILHSGHDDISAVTPLTGMEAVTTANSHDFGTEVAILAQESSASTGAFTFGFTATSSIFDFVAITVQEKVSNGFPQAEAATLTWPESGSIAVLMPPVVSAGDLLLIFYGSIDQTVTTPSGWTLLSTASNGYELNIYYKIADGTEDGTTVTLTGSVGGGRAHAYRVTNWHGTTPPEAGTAASGTSTTPDPPSLTPSWGAADTLWFAASNGGFNATPTITDYPDNFDNGAWVCPGGTQVSLVGTARRWFNGTSLDPATFTMSGSAQWVAQTVAVRPAPPEQISAQGVATVTGALTVGAPSTTNELAGTPAGVATVTGALQTLALLAGSSAGVGTVTGGLSQIQKLSGASSGLATVTGDLEAQALLSSTVSGVATVTAAPTNTGTNNLAATSAGVASVTAALTNTGTNNLAATPAGVATVTGDLETLAEFDASIAGIGTVTAALRQIHHLTTTSAGVATVSASLTIEGINALASAPAGVATVTGDLETLVEIDAGAISGVATVTAALSNVPRPVNALEGTSAGAATVTGDLETLALLRSTTTGAATVGGDIDTLVFGAGSSTGQATVTGNLTQINKLAATTTGAATVGGEADVLAAASGSSTGQATVVGNLQQTHNLRSTITGLSTVNSILDTGGYEGIIAGEGTVTAALTQVHQLRGTPAGAGSVTGDSDQEHQLRGNINGVATVSAGLSVTRNIASTIAGIASVSGDLEQVHNLNGSIGGTSTVVGSITNLGAYAGNIQGVASVTASLFQINQLAGVITGVGSVTATLANIYPLTRGVVTLSDGLVHSVTATDSRVESVSTANALVGSVTSGDN